MSAENIARQLSSEQAATIQQRFMTKVYGWMIAGLLLTALISYYVIESGLIYQILMNSFLFFGLIIGELALVFFVSARIEKISKSTATGLFLLYAALNGVTISALLLQYTAQSIQEVFFISAGMFAALSFFGYTTKKSLSGWGNFLFMGVIGLIIASVVNIFMQSGALYWAISAIGVFVFAGLTAYDTQKLKKMALLELEGNEIAGKGAIMGALSLYLDFILLFMYLLRLLGGRD